MRDYKQPEVGLSTRPTCAKKTALTHQGMYFKKPLKVCGIWHQDANRSFNTEVSVQEAHL